MMMTGLAWMQKLTVQPFTLEVENLINKPKTFPPVLPTIASNGDVSGPTRKTYVIQKFKKNRT